MNSTQTQKAKLKAPQAKFKSQQIFKWVCIVACLILIFCIPGFLRFREYCISKGYYVFSTNSFNWMTLGFFLIFGARYSYYNFMRKYIQKLVDPKYEGQERIRKTEMLMKLSYDTLYYLLTTLVCYFLFRREYWFPTVVGGCGACSEVYKQYPDWPSQKRLELQAYFCFQLGVHGFLQFELFVFRRRTERKFYEYTLHHTVAVSLILFSMMCNQITAGVMILIIHDASDIFMAFARFYFSSNVPFKSMFKSTIVQVWMAIQMIVSWVYLRLIIFPFCLLSNVYINKPMPTDEWYMINYEYMYLLTMAFVLVGMHMYWTFYLIKSVLAFINKNQDVNRYDIHKKK